MTPDSPPPGGPTSDSGPTADDPTPHSPTPDSGATHNVSGSDPAAEQLRLALGRIGERAVPAPTFERLTVDAQATEVATRPRRDRMLALATVALLVGVIGAGIWRSGGHPRSGTLEVTVDSASESSVTTIPASSTAPPATTDAPTLNTAVLPNSAASPDVCFPTRPDPSAAPMQRDDSVNVEMIRPGPSILVVDRRGDLWEIGGMDGSVNDVVRRGTGYAWARYGPDGSIYASRITPDAVVIDHLVNATTTEFVNLPSTTTSTAAPGVCGVDGYLAQFAVNADSIVFTRHSTHLPPSLCVDTQTTDAVDLSGGVVCSAQEFTDPDLRSLADPGTPRRAGNGVKGQWAVTSGSRASDFFALSQAGRSIIHRTGDPSAVAVVAGPISFTPLGGQVAVSGADGAVRFDSSGIAWSTEPTYRPSPEQLAVDPATVVTTQIASAAAGTIEGTALTAGWSVSADDTTVTAVDRFASQEIGDTLALDWLVFDGINAIDAIDSPTITPTCSWRAVQAPVGGGIGGTLYLHISLVNVTYHACSTPEVSTVSDAVLGATPTVAALHSEFPAPPPPTEIQPGDHFDIVLETSQPGLCQTADPHQMNAVSIRLGDGATLRVDLEYPLETGCEFLYHLEAARLS